MAPKNQLYIVFCWLTPKKWPNELGNWGNKTLLVRCCWFTPFITAFWVHFVGDKPECRVDDISGNHDVVVIPHSRCIIWLTFHTETGKLQLARISQKCVPHPTQLARTSCDRPWRMQRNSLEKLKKNVIWNEIHGKKHAGFVVACGNQMIECLLLVCNMHLPNLVKHCHIHDLKRSTTLEIQLSERFLWQLEPISKILNPDAEIPPRASYRGALF